MQDPHGELVKQNVLIERGDVAKTVSAFNLSVSQVQTVLHNARQQLWERRQLRPKPHLDNKMITAWNGLSSVLQCTYARLDRHTINLLMMVGLLVS